MLNNSKNRKRQMNASEKAKKLLRQINDKKIRLQALNEEVNREVNYERRTNLIDAYNRLNTEIEYEMRERSRLLKEAENLTKMLERQTGVENIEITDHVIVRLLERVCNIDVVGMKEQLKQAVANEISGTVLKNDDSLKIKVNFKGVPVTVVIRDFACITLYEG